MVPHIFIRRILIFITLVIVLLSLGLRTFLFLRENVFAEKGNAKIYLLKNETADDIKEKYLPKLKNEISEGSETRTHYSTEYFYISKDIKSEDLYDIKKAFEKIAVKTVVVKDNGMNATLKLGDNYKDKQQASVLAEKIHKETKLQVSVTPKIKTSEHTVKYIKIHDITMTQANNLDSRLKGNRDIEWISNKK